MNKFYVTTPIYYVNSYPHLGHLYTTIIADTVARYKRQRGAEVFFLTGTDEHGINIERAAEAAGLPVKEHVDKIVDSFKTAFAPYQFINNRWIRTTDENHKQGVRKLWQRAKESGTRKFWPQLGEEGYIYKGKYEGWYCGNCNEFYSEADAKLAEDGTLFCPTHERPLDRVAEESYFFALDKFEKPLLDYYEKNPDFIKPEARRNEVISFVKSGLKPLSISRTSVKWGIPVPDDPEHTMYVWFDALSNYITAIGYGNDQFGDEEDFKKFWPADLQLVGKDILRFHAVYWPAFLMAADLPLPRTVYSHGMWMSGGRKMSKTLGNVIDLAILQKHFSTDAVRYFCLREMVFGQDGDFTYEALLNRVNSDLADGLGNLSSRTLTMVHKYCDGFIPGARKMANREVVESSFEVSTEIKDVVEEVEQLIGRQLVGEFGQQFDLHNLSRSLEVVWSSIARVDKFISDAKPWNLDKDKNERGSLELVLQTATEALRYFAVLLAPVLPNATQQIWEQLGRPGADDVSTVDPRSLEWGQGFGIGIGEVRPIFPKLDKKKIMSEIKQEEIQPSTVAPLSASTETESQPAAAPVASEPVPGIAYIGIEDFLKVELRVGQILTAEPVPKADKLLRFTIDLGEAAPRQILAGIAQYYEPEKLVGRKVIVVANLAPRKLRGFESQGMILAASVGEEGRPILAGFLEEVPNGAKLK